MQRTVKKIVDEFINMSKPIIGANASKELEDYISKVIKTINSNVLGTESDYSEALGIILSLFKINTASDYIMIKNGLLDYDKKAIMLGEGYFELLLNNNNKTFTFYLDDLLMKVNDAAQAGNQNIIKLKYHLIQANLGFDYNYDIMIKLVKECAYSGDMYSLNALGNLCDENKEFYKLVFKAYKEILDKTFFDDLDYMEDVLNECKLIGLIKKRTTEDKKIDHKLFLYLFKTKDNFHQKYESILTYGYLDNENKIGFIRE